MHTVVYRYGWLKLVVVACAMVVFVGPPGPASAHERNSLGGDKYDVVVGWLAEPAFVDEPNGVDFRITRRETREPVEGLDKTLKVEVSHGASKKTLDLRARHGQPGAYTADIMPTRAGDYAFRFFGEIEGARVDDTFKSGPGRFNGVQAPSGVQFPAVEPTTAEVKAELASARVVAFAGFTAGLLGMVGSVALLLRSRRTRTVPLRA